MVMNFNVFDTNLHMINHYRRINSAKSVVNTSAPRRYLTRPKSSSSKSLVSRYSTPSVLSCYNPPPRTNSNCECDRPPRSSFRNDLIPAGRSTSVPPRPLNKRIANIVPPNYLKTNIKPKVDNKNKILSPKSVSASTPQSTGSPRSDGAITNPDLIITQIPKPTCVAKPPSKTTPKPDTVPNYEYLQFSLRITEDIIRNDLYTQKEMRRVFNSHIEANRGRLSLTKMLEHIDHLCKELNITKKESVHNVSEKQQKCCQTDSKLGLMQKTNDEQFVIDDKEMQHLSEDELQLVISGILCEDCTDCSQNVIEQPTQPIILTSDSNQLANDEIIDVKEKTSGNSEVKSIGDDIEYPDCNCSDEIENAALEDNAQLVPTGNQLDTLQTTSNNIEESHCECEVEIEDATLPKQDNELLIIETLQTTNDTQESIQEDSIEHILVKVPSATCLIEDVEENQNVKSATSLVENVNKELEFIQRTSQLVQAEEALKTVLSKTVCCSTASQTCLDDCNKIFEPRESIQPTSVAEIIELKSELSKDAMQSPSGCSYEVEAPIDLEVTDDQANLETSTIVTDSTIQYNIIDMDKFYQSSLKLGVDKFTQTSFSVEKVPFIKTPIHSSDNLISKSKVVKIESKPPSIPPPQQYNCKSSAAQSNKNIDISEYQRAFECPIYVESSNSPGPSCSIINEDMKSEYQSAFKSPKPVKVDKPNVPCSPLSKDSDFIIAIKKLTAANVNALSEILHRHPYAQNCVPGIDKYKMKKPEPPLNTKQTMPTEAAVNSDLVDSKLQNTTLSEGEICCPTQTHKGTSPPHQSNIKHNGVLEQLKKYEKQNLPENTQNERRDINLNDYKLKTSNPTYRYCGSYPAHGTQTSFNNKKQMLDNYLLRTQCATKSNSDHDENSLLSDGEMKTTEDSDNETTVSTSPNSCCR